MIENFEKSEKLFEESKKLIPGGVNSPVRAFGSVDKDFPVFAKSGKGAKVYDVDGNEYTDYICSWGPLIFGHCDEEIEAKVIETLKLGSSFGMPTENELILAELIEEIVPSIEKVRLTSSGTEAAMAGVRLARAYTKRDKIIKFEGCYHGHSDSMLVKAGSGLLTNSSMDSNGITASVQNDTLTAKYNDIDSVKLLFDNNRDKIAAVIIEPVAANMGVVLPKEGFLEDLRKVCDENGALLIFDEVISGFRVSLGGAQEYYGVTPDITILGKIIGGGYPVGAFGGKKEIMDIIAPTGNVYHAGTLSGNPVSVRAGIETLKRLKSDSSIYKKLNKICQYISDNMRDMIKRYERDITVNNIGSLFTIFFNGEKVENMDDATKSDSKLYSKYFDFMLKSGILIAPSQYEAHFISTAHDRYDVEKYLNTFERFIRDEIK